MAARFLRPFIDAKSFLRRVGTWCLWLPGIDADSVVSSPELAARLEQVRQHRSKSAQEKVRRAAERPQDFLENRQPQGEFVVMPKEVPDDASHVPVLRVSGDVVASNSLQVIDPCDPLVAGYLASRAYAIWCDGVGSHAGGLRKNSSTEVYNTFPFPEFGGPFDEEIREALDNLNQALSFHLVGTYESFYANADELPEAVKNGHQWLDRAVLASFGINSTATDEEILDALEARYHLLAGNPPHPHDGKAAA